MSETTDVELGRALFTFVQDCVRDGGGKARALLWTLADALEIADGRPALAEQAARLRHMLTSIGVDIPATMTLRAAQDLALSMAAERPLT